MSDDLDLVARLSERQRTITGQRDAAICAAHQAGHSLRAIATAATMSPEGVRRIIAKHS